MQEKEGKKSRAAAVMIKFERTEILDKVSKSIIRDFSADAPKLVGKGFYLKLKDAAIRNPGSVYKCQCQCSLTADCGGGGGGT